MAPLAVMTEIEPLPATPGSTIGAYDHVQEFTPIEKRMSLEKDVYSDSEKSLKLEPADGSDDGAVRLNGEPVITTGLVGDCPTVRR